jgi:hypothetical protein
MIKQTNKALNAKIQSYGCCFLAHLVMVNRHWETTEVEKLYAEAVTAGIMDVNCTLKRPNDLLKLAAMHKKSAQFKQMGGRLFHPDEAWGITRSHIAVEYVIVKWRTAGENFHFSLHTPKGELYDPFDPEEASYSLHKMVRISEQYYGKIG